MDQWHCTTDGDNADHNGEGFGEGKGCFGPDKKMFSNIGTIIIPITITRPPETNFDFGNEFVSGIDKVGLGREIDFPEAVGGWDERSLFFQMKIRSQTPIPNHSAQFIMWAET